MKFTDGRWLIRDGYELHYARRARQVFADERSFRAIVPTRPIDHPGDTLGGPTLTIECETPLEDVVAVTITHLAGGVPRHPVFALTVDAEAPAAVERDAGFVALTTGGLTARATLDDEWRLEFRAGGRLLTESWSKSVGIALGDDGTHHLHERLALVDGTHVYGLGERFGPLVKNGQVVDLWNADGGAGSEQAYKNVPFYVTDGGYGVFVDEPGRVSLEVASEVASGVQFSAETQSLRYLVIYGPTPKEILRKYTALTGRPALPPAWSFGLWLSTSFTTDYDEATVESFVSGMAEREIPLSVFHFDCFWMREYHWCDFEWDARVFPDPDGMLARLKERGLRVCVWINPYIAQASPLFAEAKEAGLLLRSTDGAVWQTDRWQPGMAIVDFTNPEARAWFQGKLARLLDMGVDCFKTDFGERIPTDVVWHDGSDPERAHNYYPYLYNETVFELLRARRGAGEAVVFARSATAGSQRFPVHWGGDPDSNFYAMAETLRGGLSLGLSGFGFWSHDIGGFEGSPPPALFKRWIAFGLLSSHSRLHGSGSYRVPWLIDEESVDVLRAFTRLKLRLMPYVYAAAVEATETGTPVLRAMALEFPDDPAVAYLERQYMLGPDLLVAPVMSESGAVTYYLPAGTWTHLLTGERVTGPGWRTETYSFDGLPLLVRPGAVIPWGAREDVPDYDHVDGVTLRVFDVSSELGASAVMVGAPGAETRARFEVSRRAGALEVAAGGTPHAWQVELVGIEAVAAVEGGVAAAGPNGVVVSAAAGTTRLAIQLQP